MKFQSSKNRSNFVCEKGTFSQTRSHIMHSYTIMYARTLIDTCISRLQVGDFSAWRLSIRDIKRLLLSEGSGDSTIEKFCAWVGER